MVERTRLLDETAIYSSWKLFVFLLKFELVISTRNRHTSSDTSNYSCYTCIEPLVGYTDHPGSCKHINMSSSSSIPFIKDCNTGGNGDVMEYECRKVVVSYRSVETYLRRDCAPKGLCSWKDKTQSMINTPVSDCVYTNEQAQKRECIYCCQTHLCNRTNSSHVTNLFIIFLLSISNINLIL